MGISGFIKKTPGESYKIIVSDDGVGMPADYNSQDRKSLGMFLINSLVGQIKGELTITDKKPGTEILIRFGK